jgi:hypothetical protein
MPLFVILQPERVFLALAAILIGAGFYVRPGTVHQSELPAWLLIEISVTLIAGGVVTVMGLYLSSRQRTRKSPGKELRSRSMERFGASLIAFGSATYGAGSILAYGWGAFFVGTIMIIFSFVNILRVLISTAGRSILITADKVYEEPEDDAS